MGRVGGVVRCCVGPSCKSYHFGCWCSTPGVVWRFLFEGLAFQSSDLRPSVRSCGLVFHVEFMVHVRVHDEMILVYVFRRVVVWWAAYFPLVVCASTTI